MVWWGGTNLPYVYIIYVDTPSPLSVGWAWWLISKEQDMEEVYSGETWSVLQLTDEGHHHQGEIS